MENETDQKSDGGIKKAENRPVFLTILCLSTFVFFAIVSVLSLAGIFYSDWITGVTNKYLPEDKYSNAEFRILFISGFLLHAMALSGTILIWRLKRIGYYFTAISCLIIACYQLFNTTTAITSTATYVILIFLFGIFYKQLN